MTELKARMARVALATSASALLSYVSISPALAIQRSHLKTHETLIGFAERFHTTVRKVEEANHIHDPNDLPHHMLLIVPPPPRHEWVNPDIDTTGVLNTNRVDVRTGPGKRFHRETLVDKYDRVHVTALKHGWAQVELDNGARGWINEDFVSISKHPKTIARNVSVRRKRIESRHEHELAMAHLQRLYKKEARHHQIALARLHRLHIREMRLHHEHVLEHERQLAEKKHSGHRRVELAEVTHKHGYHHAFSRVSRIRQDIVRDAFSYRGEAYVYGGTGRDGFDCSGFTRFIMSKEGVHLPHNAAAQYQMGHPVPKDQLKPGDLVFFHTVAPGISHVGIYIGHGKFIQAARPGVGVCISSLNEPYYERAYRGARRFVRRK